MPKKKTRRSTPLSPAGAVAPAGVTRPTNQELNDLSVGDSGGGGAPGVAPMTSGTVSITHADGAKSRVLGGPTNFRFEVKQKPNDPCVCGSGKKYKKCCAVTEAFDASRAGVLARHEVAKSRLDAGDARGAANEWARVLKPARLLKNNQVMGAVLTGLALAYRSLGELRHALTCYAEALALSRKCKLPDRKAECGCLVNIGIVYSTLGDQKRAFDYLNEGLVASRQQGDRSIEVSALSGLGSFYCSLGEYTKGVACHHDGLVICREIGDRHGEGSCLNELALAFFSLGNYKQAAANHDMSLVISRELGDRQREGNALGMLGLSYIHLGEYRKAIGAHEQALVISREMGDAHGEGSCLNNLGVCCFRSEEFDTAASHYSAAVEVFAALLDTDLPDNLRAPILTDQLTAFDGVVSASVALGRVEDALIAAEEARTAEIGDTLFKTPNFEHQPWTMAQTRDLAADLGAELVYYHYNKNEGKMRIWVVPQDAASKIFFVDSSLGTVELPWLDTQLQAFSEWRGTKNVIEVGSPKVQNGLTGCSTELTLGRLYDMLILPIAEELTPNGRVIFLPHHDLWLTPFTALWTTDSTTDNPRYLVEDYTVMVGLSMTTLASSQRLAPKSPAPWSSAFAVGGPVRPHTPQTEVKLPLTETKDSIESVVGWRDGVAEAIPADVAETNHIQGLLGCGAVRGPYATKERVLESMKKASVVHFATHGVVDGIGARLLLHGTASESEDCDQWLRCKDIIACGRFSAQLVVLSPCNSCRGELAKGAGVVGLAQALLAMGVPTVVLALWKIPGDEFEVSGVMRHLYARLTQSSEKIHVGTALREATLAWMKEQNKPVPEISENFWGGYQVLGGGSVWLHQAKEVEAEPVAIADPELASELQLLSVDSASAQACVVVSALAAATAYGSMYLRSLNRPDRALAVPQPRFRVGDRVDCKLGPGQWRTGTVRGLNFEGKALRCLVADIIPYVVQLDSDEVVCVPRDHDTMVQEA
eukprot:COSAG02_NODE_657_length_18797_cov_34.071238_1_plen_992_part_00